MSFRIVGCLVALSVWAFAAKEPNWERALVVSQEIGSNRAGVFSAPVASGAGSITVPMYRSSSVVVVDCNRYRYVWVENGPRPVVLPVKGEIQYYRDGDAFIVLDSHKKKHKFGLVSMKVRD